MASPALRLGVDLGGTKIEIGAIAPDGAGLARRRGRLRTRWAACREPTWALIGMTTSTGSSSGSSGSSATGSWAISSGSGS